MISIIGAGPAGNNLAYLLAKKGQNVSVYEEHKLVGKPVQCTGLVTDSIKDLVDLKDEVIVNKIRSFKVFSKNNSVEIDFKKPNLVLDRMKFDLSLAERAKKAGVNYFLSSKFQSCTIKKDYVEFDINNKKIKSNYLIGADGPFSQVAKSAGMYNNRKFMIAPQARLTNIDISDKHIIEVYIGEGYFGWVVPENENTARLGVASYENSNVFFKYLLKRRAPKSKIEEYQSGVIPMYNPKQKIQNQRVFLIGDAACHTKNPSHGGIIQGLIASKSLAEAITENKDYSKLLKNLNKDLKYNFFIRKVLDKFSDNDLDKLISLVNKEKVKTILETFDRDYPSKFLFKLIFNEPKLLFFAKYLF